RRVFVEAGSISFGPDGRSLAVGSSELVRLWDTASGSEIGETRRWHDLIESVAFCPDGRVVASGSSEGTVRFGDAAGKRDSVCIGPGTDQRIVVAFSPDGRLLAGGTKVGRIRLWETASGRPLPEFGRGAAVCDIAWSPDGGTLAWAAA